MRRTSPEPSNQPLGTVGIQRRRLLFHHLPLALASAVILILLMSLPLFDAKKYPHADLFSGTFPQERIRGGPMDHGGSRTGPMRHGGEHTGSMDHRRGHMEGMDHSGDHAAPMRHDREHVPRMHGGGGGEHRSPGQRERRFFMRQITFATGYVALGLLVLTLAIGPANLLLHRRNPVSNYLRRDAGTWAALFSVAHVIFGLQVHGGGRLRDFLMYFVSDGRPLVNSFGLGNWAGLAALVIVVGLLAMSSDFALRKLKARPWKWLQRLNYVLFALVILHAFFYGALLRMTSPYTLLLGISVVFAVAGQAIGIWLWRRRQSTR